MYKYIYIYIHKYIYIHVVYFCIRNNVLYVYTYTLYIHIQIDIILDVVDRGHQTNSISIGESTCYRVRTCHSSGLPVLRAGHHSIHSDPYTHCAWLAMESC